VGDARVQPRRSASGTDRRGGGVGPPEKGKLRCVACGHRCLIGEGNVGVCRVRFVKDGVLRVPFGYFGCAERRSDREKSRSFTSRPGRSPCRSECWVATTSARTAEWEISQVHRDAESEAVSQPSPAPLPRCFVALARTSAASMVHLHLQEPLITSEWAVAVFRKALCGGLMTSYVSNRQWNARSSRTTSFLDRRLQGGSEGCAGGVPEGRRKARRGPRDDPVASSNAGCGSRS